MALGGRVGIDIKEGGRVIYLMESLMQWYYFINLNDTMVDAGML